MSRPLKPQLLFWQSYLHGPNLINHRKWTVILCLLPGLVLDSLSMVRGRWEVELFAPILNLQPIWHLLYNSHSFLHSTIAFLSCFFQTV